jgi:hypothetical protein
MPGGTRHCEESCSETTRQSPNPLSRHSQILTLSSPRYACIRLSYLTRYKVYERLSWQCRALRLGLDDANKFGSLVVFSILCAAISKYDWSISIPIKFLPNCLATTPVVPEPIKGSRMVSLSLLPISIILCNRLSGFSVGCIVRCLPADKVHRLRICLPPLICLASS